MRRVVCCKGAQPYTAPANRVKPVTGARSDTVFDELVKDLQESLNLTVFMVTHDLDTLRATTDRIAVLVDRKIKVGTIDELRRDPHPWIQQYFSGPRGRAGA